jgi:hypothetical protein
MNETTEKLLDIAGKISRGEIPEYQHNECFAAGAFDLLLVNAHGADAYDLLVEICAGFDSLVSSARDLKGYYLLVSRLATQTKTTEMPMGMQRIVTSNPELSGELKQWYRING